MGKIVTIWSVFNVGEIANDRDSFIEKLFGQIFVYAEVTYRNRSLCMPSLRSTRKFPSHVWMCDML